MIDEPPEPFLMKPRQHREWAERARRHDRPDLALQHEQLARVIEKIAKEQAEHRDDPVPTLRQGHVSAAQNARANSWHSAGKPAKLRPLNRQVEFRHCRDLDVALQESEVVNVAFKLDAVLF